MAHHADAEIAECVRCPMMRRRYLAGIFVKERMGQIYAKRKGVKRFAFTYLP